MKAEYVTLTSDAHFNLKIKSGVCFDSFSIQHIIPINLAEIEFASSECPVTFVKNSETGSFELVIISGLSVGENLLLENAKWMIDFVPQIIKRVPLSLAADATDSEQLLVAIDEANPLVNKENGEALFNASGEESEYLKRRTEELANTHQNGLHTRLFIEQLVKLELLESMNVTFNLAQQTSELKGIYIINQQKLHALPDSDFINLKNKNYLPLIYGHLSSINQFKKLIKLKNDKENI